VRQHQLIGHVAEGAEHVHLAEYSEGTYVNPLRLGGLAPYIDDTVPQIPKLTFYSFGNPLPPESVSGIQGTSPSANPPSSWFDEAFRAVSPNIQSLYTSYAYDCTNLIALAAQTAQSDDPTKFVTEVVPTSRNGVSCRNFTDCAPVVADGFLVLLLLQVALTPAQNVVSRHDEAEADWMALRTTRDPASGRSLFQKFTKTSLAQPDPPTWDYLFLETHPTTMQRIAMTRAWQRENVPGR